MSYCIYGGQYGSEGKGCVSEWICRRSAHPLTAIGIGGPNSGHTCTLGSLRQLPCATFFCEEVWLGPTSAVDLAVLEADLRLAQPKRIFVHENAALVDEECKEAELALTRSISSTGSGNGWAIHRKEFLRERRFLVPRRSALYKTINTQQWLAMIHERRELIVECSQGILLDVNLSLYPHVTSRSTMPLAILAANALASRTFEMCGVYRTLPIRTGGPSGPCSGRELSWEELALPPEIATVTKRIRRVFEWSWKEWELSIQLCKPTVTFLTHLDYIKDAQPLRQRLGACYASRFPAQFEPL